MYLALALFGLAISGMSTLLKVRLSGFVDAVAGLTLFGIAAASEAEATQSVPLWLSPSAILAILGSAVGYRFGFKALVLYPIGAWCVGRAAAANARVWATGLVALVAVSITFTLIQGQRRAALSGESPSITSMITREPFHYSLAHGEVHTYRGAAVLVNVAGGVSTRVAGADYLFALHDAVPSREKFLFGQSLWQPALSTMPILKHILALRFNQLSLGRYMNLTFLTTQPLTDPSSQSTTVPGDLYLNFGVVGIIFGLFGLGILYTLYDGRFPVSGPTSAGLFAVVGFNLLTIDSNLAFILVSAGLHLTIVTATLWVLQRSRSV